MIADGENLRQLTDDVLNDRFPRWSPDGTRSVFYSNRSGSYEIWTVNHDGSGLRQLTKHPEEDLTNPVWSADGSKVAYVADLGASYILDLDSGVESIPRGVASRERERCDVHAHVVVGRWWWLAGHFLSDTGEEGLGIYPLETDELERSSAFGTYPAWLSDDRHVVFHVGAYLDARLRILDRESGHTRELFAPTEAGAMYPTVSKDDRTICFTRFSVESDIWPMSLDAAP